MAEQTEIVADELAGEISDAQKRADDLKLKRNQLDAARKNKDELFMKRKRTGQLTTEESSDEYQRSLLDLLPDEVLEMILSKLTIPKDLVNCNRAFDEFRKILEPTKPAWAFGEVLPYIMGQLAVKDIKNCRLVCHQWKSSVDNLLETGVFLEEKDLNNCSYKSFLLQRELVEWCAKFRVTFRSSEEINRFTTQMEHYIPDNPLPGRQVRFCKSWGTASSEYWQRSIRFLERFGQHVWNCKISGTEMKPSEFIRIVRDCLNQLPNLRRLYLSGERETNSSDKKCLDASGFQSFPELPKLCQLRLREVPSPLFSVLPMSYFKKIKLAELGDWEYEDMQSTNKDLLKQGLQNLNSLNLTPCGFEEWGSLSSLHVLQCPLETLCIRDIVCQPVMNTDQEYSRLLHHFRKTLRHVRLEWGQMMPCQDMLPCCAMMEIPPTPELFLPNIQTLELENPQGSLNFTRKLIALQYFSISCSAWCAKSFESKKQGEIIQVHGFVDNMYDSNIWNYLPSLKEFNFVQLYCKDENNETFANHYTRDGFQNFVKRNALL